MKEIEAKFYVRRLAPIRGRIIQLGGRPTTRRHLERNWRFDLPGDPLAKDLALLRLREDSAAYLTYKRLGKSIERREEIELQVSDPAAARALLAVLGFRMVSAYEKYRREFSWGKVRIMLDELPFGNFVEVEGPSLQEVRKQAERLGLAWKRRVRSTYLQVFDQLRAHSSWHFQEATFDRFAALPPIQLDGIGLYDAVVKKGGAG